MASLLEHAMAPHLTVQVTHQPGLAIAKIDGEARFELEPLEIELEKLSAKHPPLVILDLSDLTVISSLGIGIVVSLRNALREHGGRLLVCGVKPQVLDAFKGAKLASIFEIHDTLESALRST